MEIQISRGYVDLPLCLGRHRFRISLVTIVEGRSLNMAAAILVMRATGTVGGALIGHGIA